MSTFTPRPYQTPMIEQILGAPRHNLWLPMGGGKTVAVLTAYDMLRMTGEGPMLVLAPKRVAKTTWPDEVAKWDHLKHLKVSVIIGTPAQRLKALHAKADVYTINYDNLVWLCEQVGDVWPFPIVVADESTRLKSFRLGQGGKRARALGLVAHTQISRFINLTGTPSPNGLKDLWGQNWFIDRGERLGKTFTAFSQRWFKQVPMPGGFNIIKPHDHSQREIENRLADVTTSVNMADYFDLKQPIINDVFITLPPEVRRHYDTMEEEMFADIKEGIEAPHAAARSLKCLQMCSGAVYHEDKSFTVMHDEKLDALESVVNETAGANLLVAYHFQTDLTRIKARFPQARILDDNPKTIKDWNAGKISMLLAHPASAGHGLNLQDGGHHLVFFSVWWNLEEHQQIIERIGPVRQAQAGYNRPVFIHRILARHTVDEAVIDRLEGKVTVQDALMKRMNHAHRQAA